MQVEKEIIKAINYLISKHRAITLMDRSISKDDLEQEAFVVYLNTKKKWSDKGTCSFKTYVIREIHQHFMKLCKRKAMPKSRTEYGTDRTLEKGISINRVADYLDLPELKQVLVQDILENKGFSRQISNKGFQKPAMTKYLVDYFGATEVEAIETTESISAFL